MLLLPLPSAVDSILLCRCEQVVRLEGVLLLLLLLHLLLLLLLLLVGVVGIGVLEPALQQRLELAHVLEGEVQGLEPGDGGLGEVVAVQLAHGQAHVTLGVAQLDPLLFEHLHRGKK